jgi:hypothetical protein
MGIGQEKGAAALGTGCTWSGIAEALAIVDAGRLRALAGAGGFEGCAARFRQEVAPWPGGGWPVVVRIDAGDGCQWVVRCEEDDTFSSVGSREASGRWPYNLWPVGELGRTVAWAYGGLGSCNAMAVGQLRICLTALR